MNSLDSGRFYIFWFYNLLFLHDYWASRITSLRNLIFFIYVFWFLLSFYFWRLRTFVLLLRLSLKLIFKIITTSAFKFIQLIIDSMFLLVFDIFNCLSTCDRKMANPREVNIGMMNVAVASSAPPNHSNVATIISPTAFFLNLSALISWDGNKRYFFTWLP